MLYHYCEVTMRRMFRDRVDGGVRDGPLRLRSGCSTELAPRKFWKNIFRNPPRVIGGQKPPSYFEEYDYARFVVHISLVTPR
jgi:hypothetical protein